jgi:hypothetical protein
MWVLPRTTGLGASEQVARRLHVLAGQDRGHQSDHTFAALVHRGIVHLSPLIRHKGFWYLLVMAGMEREPRAHHYVPQCWLAGFTETGEKDGQLWVTDLYRKKQWPSSPANTGHRRDFYRTSAPELDPVQFEKLLSRVEDSVAPLLKVLHETTPTRDELELLLLFIAMQWVRVPAFRPFMLKLADSITRTKFEKALASPEAWTAMLKDIGTPLDERADYEKMLKFHRSSPYTLTAPTEWYLLRAGTAVQDILPILKGRRWKPFFSPSGSFVGTDNPVVLEGPKDAMVGFKNAEIVLYPVNRHLLVYATLDPRGRLPENHKHIARVNTLMMLNADEQIYSHRPDFCWIDQNGTYQTDWKLFSKEEILRSIE